jgi:hypothetical protein
MSRHIKLEIDNFRDDPIGVLGLFVKILLNAQRKKGIFKCDECGEEINIYPGELLIDMKDWEPLEMIPDKTLERRLGWLQARELIWMKDLGRHTIVAVRSWEDYV